ncbi:hypothetical protein F2Q70_00001734, partial [Brassica cretica]
SLQRLAERTRHVMLVHLDLVPVTVISLKKAAEVLRTQDKDCCTRPKLVGSRLISRGFKDIGFTQYSEVERAAEEECNLLATKLSESSVEQSPVDLSKTLFCLTARETALASFTFSDFFPIAGVGWLFDLLSGQRKKLNDVYLKLDVLFQHMIDDHLSHERSKDHDDIIDLMLKVIHKQGKDDSLRFMVDHIKGVLAVNLRVV